MMQEVNLGRKTLLLKPALLCHYMLALRVSIGEENQYVACRLYRTVLIHVLVLSLYFITSFAALTAHKSQKNYMQVSLFIPLYSDCSCEVSRCSVCTTDNMVWFLQR